MAHAKNLAVMKPIATEVEFCKLPKEYQSAMVEYCLEGVPCYEMDIHLSQFRFSYGTVDIEDAKKRILEGTCIDFKTFDEYHDWYSSYGHVPDHGDSIWPCILSCVDYELFEDGWHRFHSYVKKGLTNIPVLACISH